MSAGRESLIEALREIAESIVDTSTQEGKTLLRAATEIEVAHEELDQSGAQRTSLGGPFGDIKYEERTLNLARRIKCLGAEITRLRGALNRERTYRESQEGLPEGTLPRV